MIGLSPRIFETLMLVCFGCSWPFAIAKTIRTKTVQGKSIVFIVLIFIGYVSGIIFKLTGHLDSVILLYIVNGSLVFTEIVLYFKFRQPVEGNRSGFIKLMFKTKRQPLMNLKGEAVGN